MASNDQWAAQPKLISTLSNTLPENRILKRTPENAFACVVAISNHLQSNCKG